MVGAVATVLSAGLLMWRHQVRLRAGGADGHAVEVEALEEIESDTRVA
jgi:hypothetical protein